MNKNILLLKAFFSIQILTALFLMPCALISSLCFADEKAIFNSEEFRGFRWGSNLKEHLQLNCKYNHMQNETNCDLKDEGLTFLGVNLLNYYYSVNWENEFDYVNMRIKDRIGWNRLKDNLVNELGDQYIGNLSDGSIVYTWEKNNLEIILRDSNPELSDETTYLNLMIHNREYYLSRPFQTSVGHCTLKPCNLNKDNHCDERDLDIFDKSMGQCNKPGNYSYNSDADMDRDECITEKDRKVVENGLGTEGYECNEELPKYLEF
jgi:hypothetical protein